MENIKIYCCNICYGTFPVAEDEQAKDVGMLYGDTNEPKFACRFCCERIEKKLANDPVAAMLNSFSSYNVREFIKV